MLAINNSLSSFWSKLPILCLLIFVTVAAGGCATNAPTFEEFENSAVGRCTEDLLSSTMLILGNSRSKRSICNSEEGAKPSANAPNPSPK
jgi:hypothetical protein